MFFMIQTKIFGAIQRLFRLTKLHRSVLQYCWRIYRKNTVVRTSLQVQLCTIVCRMNTVVHASLQVLEDFQARNQKLKQRPEDLDGFMAYQALHAKQMKERTTALHNNELLDEMFETLELYGQKIDAKDSVKQDDVHEAVQAFCSGLVSGKECIADKKEEQIASLANKVSHRSLACVKSCMGNPTKLGLYSQTNRLCESISWSGQHPANGSFITNNMMFTGSKYPRNSF